jgi:hypothetical protein
LEKHKGSFSIELGWRRGVTAKNNKGQQKKREESACFYGFTHFHHGSLPRASDHDRQIGRVENQTFAFLHLLRLAKNKYRVFRGFGNDKSGHSPSYQPRMSKTSQLLTDWCLKADLHPDSQFP